MRKLFIFLFGLLFSVSYAQTYKNGTWYSLYDESEHVMNTQGDYETDRVFAPTAGILNVQWRYEWLDWVGFARKIDTKVLESANNGDNTTQVGSLAEHTDKNSNTTESFTVNRNINWIKFSREGLPTHKVIVYHLDIPLAKHILLASGDYGSTTSSYDFGEQDVLTTSESYTIALRSFLSAGDITVRSSDPEIFHIGSPENTDEMKYSVGANACASANGTATAASGGTLGKIDNYAVKVYFTPKESKNYGAVITLTDGVSTVTVSVIGAGRPLQQTITWEPEPTVLSSDTIPVAEVSSGLEPTYMFVPENILTYSDGALNILGEGTVTVTVSQAGNNVYAAAEPVVRTITIFPAVTRSEYSAVICEGDSYSDEHFEGLTETNLYFDTIPNVYGGDSIICLSLKVNPVYLMEEKDTIHQGDAGTWQEIDLSVLPVGDTTLVVRYTAITGCDSVHALHLNVLPPVTYGEYNASFCDGDSVEFAGKWYTTAVVETVLVPEKNIYGGDSIVTFAAVVMPGYLILKDTTIHMDENLAWREKEYGLLDPGTYTLYDSLKSQNGCDSIYALAITVKAIPYLIEEEATACQHEENTWRGKTLPTDEAGTFILYDSLQSQYGTDSVYALTLTVYPGYAIEDEAQVIYVGATEEWRGIDLSQIPVGDTILTKVYPTMSGCDSVYTMQLKVLPPATYGVDSIYICGKGDTAYYDGVPYYKPGKTPFTVTLSTPNQFGGDSIVELWVLAANKYDISFSKTIDEGTEEEWQGVDLSKLPAGDTTLVVIYNTIHGCDSVYTLHLTVKAVQQTPWALDNADAADNRPCKFFRNGQMYIRKNGKVYNLQGIKIEEE